MYTMVPCQSWQPLARYIAERQEADSHRYPVNPTGHRGHQNSAAWTGMMMAFFQGWRKQSVFFNQYFGEVK